MPQVLRRTHRDFRLPEIDRLLNALNLREPSKTRHFTQRLKQATEEAVLDLVGPLLAQLFPSAQRPEKPPAVGEPAPRPPAPPPDQLPPAPEVSTPPAETTPREHHLTLWARASIAPWVTATQGLHGAVSGFFGYRFDERWTLAAGFVGAHPLGASLRASVVPLFAGAAVHPVLALEVPVLFSSPLAIGVAASVGVEWVPNPWLFVGLEVPVQYFIAAPDGASRFWLFGALSAGARL